MTHRETPGPNLNLTPEQRALLAELVGWHCALADEPAVARAYAELRSALDALRHDFASPRGAGRDGAVETGKATG